MPKITKRFIESIISDPQKPLIHWDSDLKGFGVIVLPSGRRTYCVQYRNTQRVKKRLKIGVHGHITAEEARFLAKQHLSKVVQGEDPANDRKEQRDLPTINTLVQNYLEHHAPRKRPRSIREDQKLLKQIILPALGDSLIKDVSRKDIQSLHLRLSNTPYHANRVLALLSKMFSLGVSWGWLMENPVKGIERYQEEKRDRWLDDQELGRFWAALDQHPNNISALALKLLLLTGARKGELLQATWDQFDLNLGIWTKPSHLTKQKKREHLPLSEQALDVLNELKQMNTKSSTYLFPSSLDGLPIRNIQRFWNIILKKANIQNLRIHDLRHTHASHLVSSGLSLSIVGKLLGHTHAATTHRYAHLADAPLRQAAALFGNKVQKMNSKNIG